MAFSARQVCLSPSLLSYFRFDFFFIPLMPGIATSISLHLRSFLFSSLPHLCLQWEYSLYFTHKPDGFESPPVFVSWRDEIAFKCIVDGRWMINDAEPTEVDHCLIKNVYTAPPKPIYQSLDLPAAPPSYHP